jgi:MFS family permease
MKVPHKIPRGVWVLGFVSLLMDMSSELIHGLLPVFMVTVLGASMVSIGIIEGIAESVALIVKVFSGVISDGLGRRKGLTVLGYGLSAFSKPAFALATTVSGAFLARFVDRIGKGIRGAPRDALVADMVPPGIRGAAFGLRQSLDTVGAFTGPALAIVLMLVFAGDFRQVFWFATIPAFLAVMLLIVGVREPETTRPQTAVLPPIRWSSLQLFPAAYWWVVCTGGFFTLARFSEAFLILRAQQTGLSNSYAPLVLIVMNIIYALSAYPAGKLADRLDRRHLLLAGLLLLLIADIVLAQADSLTVVFIGVVLWGLHMGMTQGLLAAMVADTAPEQLRGTAFGFFNLVSGVAMLFASVIAGVVWEWFGAGMTFYTGAVITLITMILLQIRKV